MLVLAKEVLGGVMGGVFEPWIGQPVVLRVALGQFKLRLLGKVLREQGDTLLMRPQCGPDLEISKTKVLAIEERTYPRAHACRPEYGSFGRECLRFTGRVRLSAR
jgi:hypothetical protein